MNLQYLMRLTREDNGDARISRAWFEARSGGEASAFRAALSVMKYGATQDGGDQMVL